MPPKKREEKTLELVLVQRLNGVLSWTYPDDTFGVRVAYGWSDGSITWKKD